MPLRRGPADLRINGAATDMQENASRKLNSVLLCPALSGQAVKRRAERGCFQEDAINSWGGSNGDVR